MSYFKYQLANGQILDCELKGFDRINEAPMDSGIYILVCTGDDKCYVGKSEGIRIRLKAHLSGFRHKRHPNRYMQSAFEKHSEGSFVFGILELVPDKTELGLREAFHANRLDATNSKIAFNLQPIMGVKSENCTFKGGRKSTLSEFEIARACKLLNNGNALLKVSKDTGLSLALLSNLKNGIIYAEISVKHFNKLILSRWTHNQEMTNMTDEERVKYQIGSPERNQSVLTREQVEKACYLMKEGYSDTKTALRLGVNSSTITNIRTGRNWSDVSFNILPLKILLQRQFNRKSLIELGYPAERTSLNSHGKNFNKEQVIGVYRQIKVGKSDKEISETYKVSVGTIKNIRIGKTWNKLGMEHLGLKGNYEPQTKSLTKNDVEDIWALILEGSSDKDIASLYNVVPKKISRIRKLETYAEIGQICSKKKIVSLEDARLKSLGKKKAA